jgi:hypothetical protein
MLVQRQQGFNVVERTSARGGWFPVGAKGQAGLARRPELDAEYLVQLDLVPLARRGGFMIEQLFVRVVWLVLALTL